MLVFGIVPVCQSVDIQWVADYRQPVCAVVTTRPLSAESWLRSVRCWSRPRCSLLRSASSRSRSKRSALRSSATAPPTGGRSSRSKMPGHDPPPATGLACRSVSAVDRQSLTWGTTTAASASSRYPRAYLIKQAIPSADNTSRSTCLNFTG